MSGSIGFYDKIVISVAILAFISGLFKVGIVAAILKFFFVLIFLKVLQFLLCWIVSDLN